MAKRFTDTDKWKKPFIRGLQGAYKLLWFYICDDCDHAGIWQVDMEIAKIRIGEQITESEAIHFFSGKIIVFDSGTKWFIPSFIEFQYPSGLNPTNKAHGSAIKILEKYNLLQKEIKPLTSPLQGAKDMDMDKELEMGKEMVSEKIKNPAQFPTMNSHGELQLNETEINKAIEITINQKLSSYHVLQLWGSFRLLNFDGTNFYENDHEIKKHFFNWVRLQKIPINGSNTNNHAGSNGTAKKGTSEERVDAVSALK